MHSHPKQFYVDVSYGDESTYDVDERHIPIDPTFHVHLQKHQEDNISEFFVLLEVISARKRKRQQPFMNFSKSKYSRLQHTHKDVRSCWFKEWHMKRRQRENQHKEKQTKRQDYEKKRNINNKYENVPLPGRPSGKTANT